MKKSKWVMSIILSCIIVLNVALESKAQSKVDYGLKDGRAESITVISENGIDYVIDASGRKLEVSKLPSFSSREEAMKYVRMIKNEVQRNVLVSDSLRLQNNIGILGNSSSGSYIVDKRQVGLAGYINLNVTYTTSGPNFGGSIIEHNAYTTFTGFTFGFSWDEKVCTSKVSSSGKDIIASATGELVFYFLINNVLEVGREAVSLSGICAAAR